MANKITLQAGQTLYDIALQIYGHVEGVAWLIEDNNLEWNSTVPIGTRLSYRDAKIDKNLAKYYSDGSIVIASAPDNITELNNEGGDFNQDFNNDFF